MEARRALSDRTTLILCAVALALLHLFLVVYFEPLRIMFSGEPIALRDFHTHAEQAFGVSEALDGWGRSWAYDVQLLAGYPTGTVFDADNKAWELWTFGLWKLGIPRPVAFNLFVLLAHLALPLVILGAARLVRMGWRASLIAWAWASACGSSTRWCTPATGSGWWRSPSPATCSCCRSRSLRGSWTGGSGGMPP
jgi:hypothetical protein